MNQICERCGSAASNFIELYNIMKHVPESRHLCPICYRILWANVDAYIRGGEL